MSLHQRRMTRPSIEHAAPNTARHRKDVAQARRLRNAQKMIIVSRPAEETLSLTKPPCLSGHGVGWQYIAREGKLVAVPQEEFICHHDEIRRTRTRYKTKRYDKKLDCVRVTTRKLSRESPLAQFGVTLSPPHGEALKRIENILRGDSGENCASNYTFKILDRIGRAVAEEYERITGRIVTGLGVHLDTKSPHFHLQNTRITEDLKLTGDKGQGTSGSLFTIYRELQLGIIDSNSERAKDFYGKMEHFEKQRGGIPADIHLCNFVDQTFEKVSSKCFPVEGASLKKFWAKRRPSTARPASSRMRRPSMRESRN